MTHQLPKGKVQLPLLQAPLNLFQALLNGTDGKIYALMVSTTICFHLLQWW